MDRRLELHDLLKTLLNSDAVYFQPPENVKIVYPCIVYRRDDVKVEYADNQGFAGMIRYQVTVIDRKPDNPAIPKLALLPRCSYSRFFVADKLNHDVFNIFY